MGFTNPNNSNEVLYGTSGDVRNEINTFVSSSFGGHYVDEAELPGALIIRGLERATRIINGHLYTVYPDNIPVTPVSAVPYLLDDIATDLATFYVIRSMRARIAPIPDDKREAYYADHMRMDKDNPGTLIAIQRREIEIPEFEAAYTDEVKAVRDQNQAPIFDVDSELNHDVDSRTIDQIDRERNS